MTKWKDENRREGKVNFRSHYGNTVMPGFGEVA